MYSHLVQMIYSNFSRMSNYSEFECLKFQTFAHENMCNWDSHRKCNFIKPSSSTGHILCSSPRPTMTNVFGTVGDFKASVIALCSNLIKKSRCFGFADVGKQSTGITAEFMQLLPSKHQFHGAAASVNNADCHSNLHTQTRMAHSAPSLPRLASANLKLTDTHCARYAAWTCC